MAPGRTTIVLIAGLSGSGKSELARALACELPDAAILPLDSYYNPLSHLTIEERARVNFDHPDSLDWPLMREHLRALKAGGSVEVPIYNFATHDREAATQTAGPARFVLAEGLLSLADAALRELADLRVFVETPQTTCLGRRVERDVAERGRTAESVHSQWRETVWPMAQEFILPSRQWADVIVAGDNPLPESAGRVLDLLSDHALRPRTR